MIFNAKLPAFHLLTTDLPVHILQLEQPRLHQPLRKGPMIPLIRRTISPQVLSLLPAVNLPIQDTRAQPIKHLDHHHIIQAKTNLVCLALPTILSHLHTNHLKISLKILANLLIPGGRGLIIMGCLHHPNQVCHPSLHILPHLLEAITMLRRAGTTSSSGTQDLELTRCFFNSPSQYLNVLLPQCGFVHVSSKILRFSTKC